IVFVLQLAPRIRFAQSASTGGIAGVVKDATGAVMPGVPVDDSSPALIEKSLIVATDSQGQLKIVGLRPGKYCVTFSLRAFADMKREGIELTAGFTANVNAELRLGSVAESITVSGASPIVDTHSVRSQNLLSRAVLDSLPTSKTIPSFSELTLGMSHVGARDV